MISATYSERHGDEIYVYILGRLVLKRWLGAEVSAVFHVAPLGVRYFSDRFPTYKAQP